MRSVSTVDELLALTKNDSIELLCDIDCQGRAIPVLCSVFFGSIDGHNHSIRNLVIDDPFWGDEQKIALFRHISNASIKNIRFESIMITLGEEEYSPSIAGFSTDVADSELKNISMTVFTSNGDNIPMIYGSVGGTVEALSYICNGENYKIYEYKEGSLYDEII